nr:MAG TPA: hypothetical protein [Caudoviricetes sp.]
MTVLHILVAMPCAKICSDIDGTIKLTFVIVLKYN